MRLSNHQFSRRRPEPLRPAVDGTASGFPTTPAPFLFRPGVPRRGKAFPQIRRQSRYLEMGSPLVWSQSRKAITTLGSNCVPEQRRNSASVSSKVRALL